MTQKAARQRRLGRNAVKREVKVIRRKGGRERREGRRGMNTADDDCDQS
jgi:hypothetical protein